MRCDAPQYTSKFRTYFERESISLVNEGGGRPLGLGSVTLSPSPLRTIIGISPTNVTFHDLPFGCNGRGHCGTSGGKSVSLSSLCNKTSSIFGVMSPSTSSNYGLLPLLHMRNHCNIIHLGLCQPNQYQPHREWDGPLVSIWAHIL